MKTTLLSCLCRVLAALLLCGGLLSCGKTSGRAPDSGTQSSESGTGTASPAGSDQGPVPIDPSGDYVSANYAAVSGQTVNRYPRLTNLPALYLTLDGNRTVEDIPYGQYIPGSYTFVSDYVEDSYYELPMTIKGRGNYSWTFFQKPYTLKLDEKADFLGMGAAKRWVLVTVSSDRTMMRNYMTQKLAGEMGLPGTCDNEFIDVLVNGAYLGTYVLTEKIEFDENRIDVPDEDGILFEIEMVYRHACENCVVLYEDQGNRDNSIHLEIREYRGEDIGAWRMGEKSQRIRGLQSYFDQIAAAMRSGDYAALRRRLDIDSFVNWYLLNEITRNFDSAFVTSCYCYIDGDSVLHMGPCWDYDTCYGSQDGQSQGQRVQDAPWYGWLFQNCPGFVQAVKERWTEIRLSGMIDKFLADIDVTRERIALSEKMEHTKYPESEVRSYASYDEAVKYLKDWLDARLKWMDSEFLIQKQPVPVKKSENQPMRD